MIEAIIARDSLLHKPFIPYHLYADGKNGNWMNAFGGGKVSNTPTLTGNKIYTARTPLNVFVEFDYD